MILKSKCPPLVGMKMSQGSPSELRLFSTVSTVFNTAPFLLRPFFLLLLMSEPLRIWILSVRSLLFALILIELPKLRFAQERRAIERFQRAMRPALEMTFWRCKGYWNSEWYFWFDTEYLACFEKFVSTLKDRATMTMDLTLYCNRQMLETSLYVRVLPLRVIPFYHWQRIWHTVVYGNWCLSL